ncbi:hypothetical protein KUCAC02_035216, partial [Chaenocephalus aceratus]
ARCIVLQRLQFESRPNGIDPHATRSLKPPHTNLPRCLGSSDILHLRLLWWKGFLTAMMLCVLSVEFLRGLLALELLKPVDCRTSDT